MKNPDKIFFGFLLGAVLPVILFLAGWWGTFKFVPEHMVAVFAFSGLLLGVILDFFFMRKVLINLYDINVSNLMLVYVFYSVCCFGFFMGVPVFNILLGIPAGYYTAMKCIYTRRETAHLKYYFHRTAVFTALIITIVCLVSAGIALSDPYTASGIKGLLKLNFEITKTILLMIVVFGGIILIALQYYLTKFTAKFTYKFFAR